MFNSIKTSLLSFCILLTIPAFSQTDPFQIAIEPVTINNLGGTQSYAVAQTDGKWLIVGGRTDGLHRRQPWAAFDLNGHNKQLLVIDPVQKSFWTAPLTTLPVSIQEQLSSTNIEFYQRGDYLYCVGGYGFSATANDHITYPNLTAINVPGVVDAIVNGNPISGYFRQITDTMFQVTGGRLRMLNDMFYLLGGQKFIGRYNPMGPDFGPGFVQEYTNAIRVFKITDDGTNLSVTHLPAYSYTDTVNLHRRDYNAESQIMPNGEQGITMFSGVFQYDVDLPYLNCVNIDTSGYTVNNAFSQYFNHYHCPVLPLYSDSANEMHTVFFGGIAQYYTDTNGNLVQDNNVPFVNTIARVTRTANGQMTEYELPVKLPALLGAGAEFIANEELPKYSNGVLKLDELEDDSTLVGYIYGGIESTQKNIFFINDGTQSSASTRIFKVYLLKGPFTAVHNANEASTGSLKAIVYPNPNSGNIQLLFNLKKKDDVRIVIRDISGKVVFDESYSGLSAGKNILKIDSHRVPADGVYFISVETTNETDTRKLILKRK